MLFHYWFLWYIYSQDDNWQWLISFFCIVKKKKNSSRSLHNPNYSEKLNNINLPSINSEVENGKKQKGKNSCCWNWMEKLEHQQEPRKHLHKTQRSRFSHKLNKEIPKVNWMCLQIQTKGSHWDEPKIIFYWIVELFSRFRNSERK